VVSPHPRPLSPQGRGGTSDENSCGLYAQLACIWEATARKPGNVHRFRDFTDAGYVDFLASAAAIGPVLDATKDRRVGETVLAAVRATRAVTKANTNLGIILLLAPLAATSADHDLQTGIAEVLGALDVEDARLVYEAIRLAAPGGLGRVPEQDVSEEPSRTLAQVMAMAADRDLIARQYAYGFRDVLVDGVAVLRRRLDSTLEDAIIHCHLHFLSNLPDSLIARKRGVAEAIEARDRARRVIAAGWPQTSAGRDALAQLDVWLRAKGNGRNPGATADLVAASLFAALREGIIKLPVDWRSSAAFPE